MNTSLLTSWKEIAAHLGKGVRTVQRWERELGLPVRRPDRQHSIVAFPSELDEWFHQAFSPRRRQTEDAEAIESLRREVTLLRQQLASALATVADLQLALRNGRRDVEMPTSTKDLRSTAKTASTTGRSNVRYSRRQQVCSFSEVAKDSRLTQTRSE